ncbi:SNW domain-containing protein 1-like [Sycon ciliatum]|uniref:SNW domain-containing protein 1-like n=1 Tax=Sycon ciliatum TaxID=27933 RepID=UPI0031F6A57D
MASLSSVLPAPAQLSQFELDAEADEAEQNVPVLRHAIPPYGRRKGWIPRSQADFQDGGAFPEVLVAQYPLGMGQEKGKAVSTQALALRGHHKDRVVFSKFEDLLPKHLTEDDPELQLPTEEEIEESTNKTREALDALVAKKIAAAQPNQMAEKLAPAQYVRYTPAQQGVAYASGSKQRVIRMMEAQNDPMEPPKFKTNTKIPRGPPSPPAPIMHSPPRKPTVKDQQDWKIPPCISNWKNARGYTIPLDKRLAADGRDLQDPHINDKFAKLAEALFIADRKAREAVDHRSSIEKKLAQKEKEKKESELRDLAQKTRDQRAGIRPSRMDEEDTAAKERDELRHERHKERERDRRIARAAPDKRHRLEHQNDRDVSEKIALGQPIKAKSDDGQFDQRLFNQSRGLDSGFQGGEDESYNVYSEPWRNSSQSIYRPRKNAEKDVYGGDVDELLKQQKRFVPDKGFAGADGSGRRDDGPVQFEKEDADPFNLENFFQYAKKGKRSQEDGGGSSSKKSKR